LNVTALRPGRTRAVIQRPHRKRHVASMAARDQSWLTLCGREVATAGTDFQIIGTLFGIIDDVAPDDCSTCAWTCLLLTHEFNHYTQTTNRSEATR
jgi:hypothetical protein